MDPKYIQIRKQIEAKQEAEKTKSLKEVVKNEADFKKDMAKFYGVNPGATKDVDLRQFIGQQGKENSQRPQTVPSIAPPRSEIQSQKSLP